MDGTNRVTQVSGSCFCSPNHLTIPHLLSTAQTKQLQQQLFYAVCTTQHLLLRSGGADVTVEHAKADLIV